MKATKKKVTETLKKTIYFTGYVTDKTGGKKTLKHDEVLPKVVT